MRLLYALGLVYLGFCSWYLAARYILSWPKPPTPLVQSSPPIEPSPAFENPALAWFHSIKPRCNAVEVETALRYSPPPETTDGAAYKASCYALAGKIDRARDILEEEIPQEEQHRAAGVVFAVGHPVADAGDDESSGPIMHLVLEYQPQNYMALYHAGMSDYILGDLTRSEQLLREFLEIYQNEDGWRRNATIVLARIENEG